MKGRLDMRILMINSVCGIKSTGRICIDLAKKFLIEGHEVRIAYGRGIVPSEYQSISIPICNKKDVYLNALKARLFDNEGFNCKTTTAKFLKFAEKYDPDLLWLHNLHGYYINVEMLFRWIKSRPNMQIRWSIHDCWAFTGHCSHFSYVGCNQWQTYCKKCIQKKQYPKSYIDNCKENFERKKIAFCGIKNMTLISPSFWLEKLIKKSFLKEYPIKVVHITTDDKNFKPTESNFRTENHLLDKKIVLGVASVWNERKGLYDFIKLRNILDKSYEIVLVGLSKKQMVKIRKKIVCIPRTDNTKELAKIYTAADVFVNPSKEETFGLTNLEALLCGTPVIVYKNTACEEVINLYGNGVAVDNSIEALATEIIMTVEKRKNST
jgi:putative colanic acid biosynthesis glycosyltransferase